MVSEAPPFWWTKADWRAWSLAPASFLYGKISGRRLAKARRVVVPAPVICVGNFTVGGAGKTPTAIALARAAMQRGLKPGFLSRGYGGSLDVTTIVDPHHHRAGAVGDEALLLAREAITAISRKRVEGAQRLVAEGVDLIIMDDGFQSARIVIDFALIVIDSVRGVGNGHLVPAGPVRAPIAEQMRHLSAILKVGNGDAADPLVRQAARAGKPFYVASLVPQSAPDLQGQPVLGFAGIADPEKFYRTVEALGAKLVERRSFSDHHYFSDDEVADILADADRQGLLPVTTAKDAVRLAGGHGSADQLLQKLRVVEVDMIFDDPHALNRIIDSAMASYRQRRLSESRSAA
ncbi:tetraacyldisaccharide 4'-kinase [Pseudorhizobium tarimense]|uniref:Tetraacyldisaccharide 4'-kinase n=1 Tax=Pseudorhizobium tarimense TaxID=1079109 RepID=A0ABV2H180_9HYPH|nr:tetraacyldisaccharide 4'-kinase [Pseudorhizobium tarimense]MCJ8517611.1 tetraacyldisaccharide 4'-kinase [Pseudorhizobium tarimense]